jgi:hypothetical protein
MEIEELTKLEYQSLTKKNADEHRRQQRRLLEEMEDAHHHTRMGRHVDYYKTASGKTFYIVSEKGDEK